MGYINPYKKERGMICDDPFWAGCRKPAAFKRNQKDNNKPDKPIYLCEECFLLTENDENFNAEEWLKMVC
jgi:hypothetical protein